MANSERPAATASPETSRGLFAALTAFVIWGLLPLYLRPLAGVAAGQIMASRLVFCCVFVLAWLAARGELRLVRAALGDRGTRVRLGVTALRISSNWLVYVWGVTHGRVIETSLGYFINPLVNVVLGVVVLSERLNRTQWSAVGLAALAVVYLTWLAGHPPFIALALAGSFGVYGLIRKLVPVEALAGLGSETLLLAPLGLGYLALCEHQGTGALGHAGPATTLLLLGGGPLTAIPLALFAFGARRIPYSTLGLLQYVGPSLQLVLGLVVYREPLQAARLLGFALIWLALAIYAVDGFLGARRATS